ncbi:hypothetical protein KR093_008425, partial [Drosophila rubida]
IEMSQNDKQNSSGAERPATVVSHCRMLLEELVVFIIFFMLSVLFLWTLISLLTGLGLRRPPIYKASLSQKPCSWPSEWCRFFNEVKMSQGPSIVET